MYEYINIYIYISQWIVALYVKRILKHGYVSPLKALAYSIQQHYCCKMCHIGAYFVYINNIWHYEMLIKLWHQRKHKCYSLFSLANHDWRMEINNKFVCPLILIAFLSYAYDKYFSHYRNVLFHYRVTFADKFHEMTLSAQFANMSQPFPMYYFVLHVLYKNRERDSNPTPTGLVGGDYRNALIRSFVAIWVRLSVIHLWFSCISAKTAERIDSKRGGHSHDGPPPVWLAFVNKALNLRRFLASEWSSSFRVFSEQDAAGIELNFGGPNHHGLLRLNYILVSLHGLSTISWRLIREATSVRLQTKRWADLTQIWWAKN